MPRAAEREDVEKTLRETKAMLEFILKAAQVGDWDLDLVSDTSRRSLRHDQCFGYQKPIPEAEWGIEVFSRHLHPDDRSRVVDSLRKAAKELLDWSSEFRVIGRTAAFTGSPRGAAFVGRSKLRPRGCWGS